MTKVHKVVLLVVDDEDVGAEDIRAMIEDARFPNHCIAPRVQGIETRSVGWSDEHPLNKKATQAQAFRDLFDNPSLGDRMTADEIAALLSQPTFDPAWYEAMSRIAESLDAGEVLAANVIILALLDVARSAVGFCVCLREQPCWEQHLDAGILFSKATTALDQAKKAKIYTDHTTPSPGG